MGTYEIAFLVGAVFAVFSVLSLASMLLDSGNAAIFFTCAVLAAGGLYVAYVHGPPEGLQLADLTGILYALVGDVVN